MLSPQDLAAVQALIRQESDRLLAAIQALLDDHRPVPHVLVTTEQAAHLLGLSRPALLALIATDPPALPYQWAGAHRRLKLADVMAYKEQLHGPRPQDPSDSLDS